MRDMYNELVHGKDVVSLKEQAAYYDALKVVQRVFTIGEKSIVEFIDLDATRNLTAEFMLYFPLKDQIQETKLNDAVAAFVSKIVGRGREYFNALIMLDDALQPDHRGWTHAPEYIWEDFSAFMQKHMEECYGELASIPLAYMNKKIQHQDLKPEIEFR